MLQTCKAKVIFFVSVKKNVNILPVELEVRRNVSKRKKGLSKDSRNEKRCSLPCRIFVVVFLMGIRDIFGSHVLKKYLITWREHLAQIAMSCFRVFKFVIFSLYRVIFAESF